MKIEVEIGTLGGILAEIGSERNRQINSEGWTPVHDDGHDKGELAVAAACYATESFCLLQREPETDVPFEWPWEPSWWKPGTPRRMLVKAAALIVAEIERLDRATPATTAETRGPAEGGR